MSGKCLQDHCSCTSGNVMFLIFICIVSIYLQDLYNKYPGSFEPPDIEAMLEFEWNIFIETEKKVSTI